ncbi:MAG: MFS transporter [Ruminococcaceae bacterium]|nr:MFS transporter [Oscillospiraceae bacterium]
MKRFFGQLKKRAKTSPLFYVYNVKNDLGRGRFCMLLSSVMAGLVGQLSGSLFYTSFLLMYGLDKSEIGILTFIPYLTCLLNIFSPSILERFKKRKWILVISKLAFYTVNIIGITLLPMLVKDAKALMLWFVIFIIIANAINQIFSSGFSAWNANFLPDHVRVDYFNSASCINSAITFAVTLAVSAIGDSLKDTPQEGPMLIAIRFIAFALAIVDCAIWLIPKEFPYATAAKTKFSNIFTLPFKNKRFLGTILIAASYTFALNIPNATLNAYILDDVGISYTLCNGINATYFLFFLFFSNMWKKLISRHYWFRAFAVVLILHAATYYAYSFVTADTVWLYVTVRFAQHILGVATGTIMSSLPYINLPDEDRTNYLSFHTIVANLAAFFSMMIGTVFTKIMGEHILRIFGYPFSSTQILLFVCAVLQCVVAAVCVLSAKALTPPEIYNGLKHSKRKFS